MNDSASSMTDFLIDSDVVIWHLRGQKSVVASLVTLSQRGRIGISAITRAEVIQGMRDSEREGTLAFLDACETIAVDQREADRAGELVRSYRSRGITVDLPDAFIAATALERGIPFFTCNARHFPMDDLDLREIKVCEKS